jgi:hypothetical protein
VVVNETRFIQVGSEAKDGKADGVRTSGRVLGRAEPQAAPGAGSAPADLVEPGAPPPVLGLELGSVPGGLGAVGLAGFSREQQKHDAQLLKRA